MWSDSWVDFVLHHLAHLLSKFCLHQPEQNLAEGGTTKIKVNPINYPMRWTTLYRVCVSSGL